MAYAGISSIISALVALLALALAVVTWMAYRRVGNRKIVFVSAAFATHAVKSVLVAFSLATAMFPHEMLEIIEAAFDLLMVVLLAIPFAARP